MKNEVIVLDIDMNMSDAELNGKLDNVIDQINEIKPAKKNIITIYFNKMVNWFKRVF